MIHDVRENKPTLLRVLTRWDLTAIGVNQVIGSGIFLMPAAVVVLVGNWSPVFFLAAGFVSLLFGLCFAELGSRFEGTGGPYLHTRAAFGRFPAFQVGWLQWFTRASSYASVANGLVLALGYYSPAMTSGVKRALILTALLGTLAYINVRGIRQSAWTINILTIGKLLPLGIFIVVGLFHMDWSALTPLPAISWTSASATALLLIFAFGGYEVVPVPAGESGTPRRHVPFALVTTILSVTGIMIAAQIVAMGTNPNLGGSSTPLADSAFLFMGAAGALLLGGGTIVSIAGNSAGQVLAGSRTLFALAENGDLPEFFGTVHPRFRTPTNAVLFTSAVSLVLAISGSFVWLAVASALSRLLTYAASCAAVLVLRHPRCAGRANPATFVIPFGPVVPVLAVLVTAGVIAGVSSDQILGGLAAVAAGTGLYFLKRRNERRSHESSSGSVRHL